MDKKGLSLNRRAGRKVFVPIYIQNTCKLQEENLSDLE